MSDAETAMSTEQMVSWTDTEWPTVFYSEQEKPRGVVKVATMTLNVVSAILNLTFNSLWLVIIQRAANIQPTTKIFMASLTISDLFHGLVIIPLSLALETASYSTFGMYTVDVGDTCINISILLSLVSLLALTADRYLAIAWCLHYPRLMTVRRAKFFAVCIFGSAVMYGASYEIVTLNFPQGGQVMIFTNCSILLVGLTMIVAMYIHILVIARRQARRIAQDNQPAQGHNAPKRASTKSFTTVIIIVAFLIIGWIPGVVLIPMGAPVDVIYIVSVLYSATHWMNAIIFCLRNKDLRETLRRIISACRGAVLKKFGYQKP